MYSLESHPTLLEELIFTASRSGGPGGQNVNKVSSKVEARFKVAESKILSEEEKEIIINKLRNKINNEGYLIITSQEERSQLANKQKATEKFFSLINSSLIKKKKRRKSKPTLKSQYERLEKKKIHAEKKASRKFRLE